MLESKDVLSILYEGKSEQIPICSSIEELEQEFINKFQAQKNISYNFYYKINNDIDIILTQDSFSDFIELNITTLFADKKKENIMSESDMTFNEQKLNSGLDLFIQEIKKEKTKLKLVKNKFIESKEIELSYKIVNNKNSSEKHIINDMKLKIKELSEENDKLKEKKEKQNIIKKTKVISHQYNGQNSQKKEIESLKKEINELKESNNNLKKAFENKEKELIKKNFELVNENTKLTKDKENLNNEIKNMEFIKEDLTKQNESLKKKSDAYKSKVEKLRDEITNLKNELEAKKQTEINKNINQSQCSSNGSTIIDSMYKSDSSKKEIKRNKVKIINKLYQKLKEQNLYRTNNDYCINLGFDADENLNESQISNKKEYKHFREMSEKIAVFEKFRKKLSEYRKNK